mgnify:CR=1 FL=1
MSSLSRKISRSDSMCRVSSIGKLTMNYTLCDHTYIFPVWNRKNNTQITVFKILSC